VEVMVEVEVVGIGAEGVVVGLYYLYPSLTQL
jgi:hypothetical protein